MYLGLDFVGYFCDLKIMFWSEVVDCKFCRVLGDYILLS